MNQNFKSNERELIKVATFFKRQSRKLIDAGKLDVEHMRVSEAVDRFVAHMEEHADTRAKILEERESLRKLVKDQAVCPRCKTYDKIKLSGTEKDKSGRTSNRYRCRKCNIQFTWNRPNNPWDMIGYIEEVILALENRLSDQHLGSEERDQLATGLAAMRGNLDQLKPVIEAHDEAYRKLQERDLEMEKIIHEFKNSLLIEKIKMDTWENKKPG